MSIFILLICIYFYHVRKYDSILAFGKCYESNDFFEINSSQGEDKESNLNNH